VLAQQVRQDTRNESVILHDQDWWSVLSHGTPPS
jgi:hypothetical protein